MSICWACGEKGATEERVLAGNEILLHKDCAKRFDEHHPFSGTVPTFPARAFSSDAVAEEQTFDLKPERPLSFE